MQHSQNNNLINTENNLNFIENEKLQPKIQHDPLSRGIGVFPSEYSEPIPSAIEDDNHRLIRRSSSKSNDDITSPSVPPYDIGQSGYDLTEDDDDNDENEGPLEALKRQEDAKRTPLQNKLYYFFEFPISNWARAYSWLSLTINLASISILCINSEPIIMSQKDYDQIWYCMDIAFYSSNPLSPVLRFVGILRLFRVVKLLRISRTANGFGFNFSTQVFIRSSYQLLIGAIYVLIIIIVSSVFIYYAERGEFNTESMTWYRYNEKGQLERYGDVIPVTSIGKLIAGLTMSLGILAIALPTTIIGSNFMDEWSLRQRAKVLKRIHKSHKQRDKSFANLNNIARSKALQIENTTILELILEVQDRLAEINPPDYYIRYKDYKEKHKQACDRIHELERQLEKQKRITNNFDIFYRKFKKSDDSNIPKVDNDFNIGYKKKTLNFPHFRKSRTFSNFGDTYATFHTNPIYGGSRNIDPDNQSETKPKIAKIFSINTLKKKIARTFSIERDAKSSKHRNHPVDKIEISQPVEIRPIFTPITDTSSITSVNSSITPPPKEKRPQYRRNISSPEITVRSPSADVYSGGSVNLAVNNNRQRGVFIQDTNSNYPIPLDNIRPSRIIKVDQGELQKSTNLSSHN
ncbi:22628_t:CDS:2, partial [Racocetra persica]